MWLAAFHKAGHGRGLRNAGRAMPKAENFWPSGKQCHAADGLRTQVGFCSQRLSCVAIRS